MIHTENGFVPVITPFEDDQQKQIVLQLVQLLLLTYKAYAYSVIHEAWVATALVDGPPLDANIAVRDQPGRRECVIVSYVSDDVKAMYSMDMIRNGESVALGEIQKFANGSVEGRFFELLPPLSVREAMTPQRFELLDKTITSMSAMFGMTPIEIKLQSEDQ